jgi:hypothetical protein
MQEQIPAMAMDGRYAGLSRPSMASEALGLLPGEMQEQFSADALKPAIKDHE